ncbi:uncharacterized protein LOC123558094 isoform X2 [Mercenaria mercenaria]|nr:uncharacterized protein LOC123558094 isoform X2 [Mercenaria mercenaria]
MGNHARLISSLCQMAGIPCVIISGMNKSAAYKVGSRCDRMVMGARWNAVFVNGDWRFLDAFWASSCVVGKRSGEWTLVDSDGNVTQEAEQQSEGTLQHRINEFYFFPDPDKFVFTHYPDEIHWQLLESPITLKEFEEHVYIKERFYELDMKLSPDSHDKCVITSKDGEIELVFSLPTEHSKNLRFKYRLYHEQKNTAFELDTLLDRFVMFEHTANVLRYTLRFPIEGKFKMDIYGLNITESDMFDLVCTYIIQCNEAKKNCLPLLDVPPIGWGPGVNTKEAGLKPITHESAIIVSEDGNVNIRLAMEKNIQLHQMLKHALIDEATLSNYAVTRLENGEAIVNIRLPQGGEYALKLYADDAGKEGVSPNVLNYLIKSEGENLNNLPFPNVSDGSLGAKPAADALGVKALSHKGGHITVNNSRVKMEFQARSGSQLMAELHSNDELACKTMLVTFNEENEKCVFDLDLPEEGEYSLNIFACSNSSTNRIYNIHSYLVKSEGRKLDAAELEMRQQSMYMPTQVPMETVQTSDNEVLIPIPTGFDDVCASLHRRNAVDPPNAHQVDITDQDGIQLFRVRLPEFGEYQMNMYDRENGHILRNIAKYQINRRSPDELYADDTKMLMQNLGAQQQEDAEEYSIPVINNNIETDEDTKRRLEEEQLEAIRRHIQKAVGMKNPEMLERYIQAYEKLNPSCDDEALLKAKRTLTALGAKEELIQACQRRDLDFLKKAISRAKEVNYAHQLDLQLAMANKLRDQLERIEKLRHSVLNLDSKTIAEIKTYSSPPDGVHQSMMATFILLGSAPKEVRNWRTCQALVGKTGRESLMRRISSFDPNKCSLAVAKTANRMIEDYSMSQIRDVSAGAATFFGWSQGMIEQIESTSGSGINTITKTP